jgi:putative membrane protein
MRTFVLALLTAVPLAAIAASNSPDESFYRSVAEAGNGEVELGNLAQQKSNNEKVKDFGAMMVKDHTAANDKLKALAASKNISLPTGVGAANMATKGKLELLKGESFDKAYIKGQVKDHVDTVRLLRKEMDSGQDADAKAFAKSVLPTVESHLKAARAIEAAQTGKT